MGSTGFSRTDGQANIHIGLPRVFGVQSDSLLKKGVCVIDAAISKEDIPGVHGVEHLLLERLWRTRDADMPSAYAHLPLAARAAGGQEQACGKIHYLCAPWQREGNCQGAPNRRWQAWRIYGPLGL